MDMFFVNILIAVLIAALSGMGVGGGGLLVIWLVLTAGMPAPTAQGINLLFSSYPHLPLCPYISDGGHCRRDIFCF